MFDASAVDILKLPSVHLNLKNKLPRVAGIYIVLDSSDRVRYIGLSRDIKNRWIQHHRIDEFKALGEIKIAYLTVSDYKLLGHIEIALISYFKPDLNNTRGGNIGKGHGVDLTRTSFRIEEFEFEILEDYCKSVGRTKSDVLRELIRSLKPNIKPS